MRYLSGLLSLFIIFSVSLFSLSSFAADDVTTSFQTSSQWTEHLHVPADVAIVYGDQADKMKSWSDRGYTVWTMIGASWLGKNDPVVLGNPDIVQTLQGGMPFEMIPGRAWVVPVGPWIDHTKKTVDRVLEAGTGALLPEEPEFFALTGYSESFQQEWKKFYGSKWIPPDSSLDALWRAGQLKAKLFTDFYNEIFAYTKSVDTNVRCIIPAHSNLNYAHWNIIAPHYDFSQIPDIDGFVGQVWTGTSKERHPVGGDFDGHIFNYAFLEYSFFANLLRGTGKDMWFLTDPVEDLPGATWDDLRNWYEQTLVASLMFPDVNRYEITPWPNRYFRDHGLYGGGPIPEEYATELYTIWAAEDMMPAEGKYDSGPPVIGALTSDSLMWQRKGGRDRFPGFAAPMMALVKRGVPVQVLPVERIADPGFIPPEMKILMAGFDAWKPRAKETVDNIAAWVKSGGTLIFIGGTDDFNDMENSWWIRSGYSAPGDALLDKLGLDWKKRKSIDQKTPEIQGMRLKTSKRSIEPTDSAPPAISATGKTSAPLPLTLYGVPETETWITHNNKPLVWKADVGDGSLIYAGFPGEFIADEPDGDSIFMALIQKAADISETGLTIPGNMVMRRGPFVAAFSHSVAVKLDRTFLNILRPENPISDSFTVEPGEQVFLMDAEKAVAGCNEPGIPCLLIASGKVNKENSGTSTLEITVEGPAERTGIALFKVPGLGSPYGVSIESDSEGISQRTYSDHELIFVKFPLTPDGTKIIISMEKMEENE